MTSLCCLYYELWTYTLHQLQQAPDSVIHICSTRAKRTLVVIIKDYRTVWVNSEILFSSWVILNVLSYEKNRVQFCLKWNTVSEKRSINRKKLYTIFTKPLIFMLQQKYLKFNDICVSWSSPKPDLETIFLNLENWSFDNVSFFQLRTALIFFYEKLGSDLSPQSCLYFRGFQGSNWLNGWLVVKEYNNFQDSKSIFMIDDFQIFTIMLLRQQHLAVFLWFI